MMVRLRSRSVRRERLRDEHRGERHIIFVPSKLNECRRTRDDDEREQPKLPTFHQRGRALSTRGPSTISNSSLILGEKQQNIEAARRATTPSAPTSTNTRTPDRTSRRAKRAIAASRAVMSDRVGHAQSAIGAAFMMMPMTPNIACGVVDEGPADGGRARPPHQRKTNRTEKNSTCNM